MKLIKFIVPLLFVFLNVSCSQAQQSIKISNMDISEFVATYQNTANAQLLDVRTPDEWKQGSINKAAKCDFNAADFKANVCKLDKNKPIFVYCAAGGRSTKASKILEELGFKKIFNLKGSGNTDLIKAGLK
jgi:phage shock protein E